MMMRNYTQNVENQYHLQIRIYSIIHIIHRYIYIYLYIYIHIHILSRHLERETLRFNASVKKSVLDALCGDKVWEQNVGSNRKLEHQYHDRYWHYTYLNAHCKFSMWCSFIPTRMWETLQLNKSSDVFLFLTSPWADSHYHHGRGEIGGARGIT